ncbi:right-handed parallel beta-helix repeat-containing protein [Sorangium sp. So ce1078]|uniref:right-handed parallel beta-helix repeat-containing protein n=1 Tax=Sorangium sp. So ce1078 TaxID=3133329 RepID=UPI003F6271A4
MIYNVMDYGAVTLEREIDGNDDYEYGDHYADENNTNNWAAINAAIAAADAAGGGVVYFPRGVYRIQTPVQVSSDGVILAGEGRHSVILYWPDGINSFKPVLLQKANGFEDLRNVGVRDLTIAFKSGGPDSDGALHINGCVDWFCERVTVIGDGAGMSGSKTNGINVSYRSRDGIISGCVVDGVSKPGIYLGWAEHVTVVGCVVKNVKCTAPNAASNGGGFNIAGGHDLTLLDCHAYNCTGDGIQISTGGFSASYTGTITAVASQTSFTVQMPTVRTAQVMKLLGAWSDVKKRIEPLEVAAVTDLGGGTSWSVTLSKAPDQTLAVHNPSGSAGNGTVYSNFVPFRNVKIIGGSSTGNPTGITLGTKQPGAIGRDVVISGVLCENNTIGLQVASAEDVLVQGCIFRSNAEGVKLTDVTPGIEPGALPVGDLTNRITISNSEIYDSGSIGLRLRSVNNVTVQNTRIFRTSSALQNLAIVFDTTSTGGRSTDIKLLGVDLAGYTSLASIVHLSLEAGAPQTGYYELAYPQSPVGFIHAPPGSVYRDTSNGAVYRKTHGWEKGNWTASLGGHVQTTTATATVVASYTLPPKSVVHATAVVVARNTAADQCAVYRCAVGAKRHNDGFAALVGTSQKLGAEGEDASDWDVTFYVAPDSHNLELRVQGEASKTIDWVARLELDIHVHTAP